jgi:2-aminoadipate transaminase
MIESSKKYLPEEVKYNIPGEGMFIWFELPEGCDAKRMLDSDSLELKVLLVPGQAFSTAGGLKNCMRASFSLVTEKEIDEGIRRFGEMIKREYSRN